MADAILGEGERCVCCEPILGYGRGRCGHPVHREGVGCDCSGTALLLNIDVRVCAPVYVRETGEEV